MKSYEVLSRNVYFEVLGGLHAAEAQSDQKISMTSVLDMSSACKLRAELEILEGTRPSITALVVKAVALSLREHPYANRLPVKWPFWSRLVQFHDTHISVAVERDRPGLEMLAYAATLRHSDQRSLGAITQELKRLASEPAENCPRWRRFAWIVEKLPPVLSRFVLSVPRWFPALWVEHRGGAVLISSPAKYGVDVMHGIWPWPLTFSFGLVKDRPIVVNREIVARPTMTLTMSFDRRVMGGAPAARFFRTICQLLEEADTRLTVNPGQISEIKPLSKSDQFAPAKAATSK